MGIYKCFFSCDNSKSTAYNLALYIIDYQEGMFSFLFFFFHHKFLSQHHAL